jgi:hypothetical protein
MFSRRGKPIARILEKRAASKTERGLSRIAVNRRGANIARDFLNRAQLFVGSRLEPEGLAIGDRKSSRSQTNGLFLIGFFRKSFILRMLFSKRR